MVQGREKICASSIVRGTREKEKRRESSPLLLFGVNCRVSKWPVGPMHIYKVERKGWKKMKVRTTSILV